MPSAYFTEKQAKELIADVVNKGLLVQETIPETFRGQVSKRAGETYGNTGKMQTQVILGDQKFNVTLQVTAYKGATASAATAERKPFMSRDEMLKLLDS